MLCSNPACRPPQHFRASCPELSEEQRAEIGLATCEISDYAPNVHFANPKTCATSQADTTPENEGIPVINLADDLFDQTPPFRVTMFSSVMEINKARMGTISAAVRAEDD